MKYNHLRALKNGDRESFRWVYEQYHQLIYHYCLKLIRQRSWAEEATADVFITIWQKRAIVDPDAPFDPLLYKIAKDIAYNYLKKIGSNERMKQIFLDSFPLAHTKSGETILIESEAIEAIHTIVDALPNKRKEVFKLHYYKGMNNRAIAQELGISVNTVREHLARARRSLKEHHSLNEKNFGVWLPVIYLFMG